MLLIFSTPVLIRYLWQLMTVVFLHWCLMHAVLLNIFWQRLIFFIIMGSKMAFPLITFDNDLRSDYNPFEFEWTGPWRQDSKCLKTVIAIRIVNEWARALGRTSWTKAVEGARSHWPRSIDRPDTWTLIGLTGSFR